MNSAVIKVLVIEDDLGDLDLFRELLADVKTPVFHVKAAETLEAGLKRLAAEPVDVVILDLMLPDSQGLETFTRLREEAPSVPVVIHSSLSNEAIALEAMKQGAQDYLVKGRVDGPALSRTMRYAIERKRLEEALRAERQRHQQLKDIFVGDASHELGTPLTVVREGLRHILSGALGEVPAEQRKLLSLSLEAVERLIRIADKLLDISRHEPGRLPLSRTRFDMVALVQEMAVVFGPMAEGKGLQLKACSSGKEIFVEADRDRLIEVLTNLVNNAIKYTPRGSVEIHVAERNGGVECSISDTGRGIAEEDLPRVFNRGTRLGPNEEIPGAGLGLSICKDLIDLHGGRIEVKSRLNQGTQFTFHLPQ